MRKANRSLDGDFDVDGLGQGAPPASLTGAEGGLIGPMARLLVIEADLSRDFFPLLSSLGSRRRRRCTQPVPA